MHCFTGSVSQDLRIDGAMHTAAVQRLQHGSVLHSPQYSRSTLTDYYRTEQLPAKASSVVDNCGGGGGGDNDDDDDNDSDDDDGNDDLHRRRRRHWWWWWWSPSVTSDDEGVDGDHVDDKQVGPVRPRAFSAPCATRSRLAAAAPSSTASLARVHARTRAGMHACMQARAQEILKRHAASWTA